MKLPAISLWQPWGTWIAQGRKTIETRTWRTKYRGPLLIHSSKKVDPEYRTLKDKPTQGCVVALCTLVDCRPMTIADEKAAGVPYLLRLVAWVFADVIALAPWPVRGRQRLFNVELPEPLYTVDARIIRIENGSYRIGPRIRNA